MSKQYIIYTGVIFFPDGNAAAQRAGSFCKLIADSGFQPVIIGMTREPVDNIIKTEQISNGVISFQSHYPNSSHQWLKEITSVKNIDLVIKYLGVENIKCIICMDYFSIALIRLQRACKKSNIDLIEDTVDWFEKSNYKFPKNVIKDLDTNLRMRWIHKKIGKLIVISRFLMDYYSKWVKNITEIPGIIDDAHIKNAISVKYHPQDIVTFVFAGSSSYKFEKEKLDWMIRSICSKNKYKVKCKLIIIGMEKNGFFDNCPDLVALENFNSSIEIIGKKTHKECLQYITQADYSVIIREDKVLSNAGFPTKVGESFACGTPVLITPTSNISQFIPDGYGIVTKNCTYSSVNEAVDEILKIPPVERIRQHLLIYNNNPLDYKKFLNSFSKIIN